jgi:hypothetical protein
VQIVLFYQLNFPVASPILQLLLASNRVLRRRKLFHMDEAKHAVLFDEFRAATSAMLLQPGLEM